MSSGSDEMERGYGYDGKEDGVMRKEVLHDHEIAKVSREDAVHHAHLTEEELVIQKKLRRKIDGLIMPLVILV